VVAEMKAIPCFGFELVEAIDVASCEQFLVYTWYTKGIYVEEEFLCLE
jgi:hypothetical protein